MSTSYGVVPPVTVQLTVKELAYTLLKTGIPGALASVLVLSEVEVLVVIPLTFAAYTPK
jgi:hypothetical protein